MTLFTDYGIRAAVVLQLPVHGVPRRKLVMKSH
jgi:hypothetical protein